MSTLQERGALTKAEAALQVQAAKAATPKAELQRLHAAATDCVADPRPMATIGGE
jgi:hypothetical protein